MVSFILVMNALQKIFVITNTGVDFKVLPGHGFNVFGTCKLQCGNNIWQVNAFLETNDDFLNFKDQA